jgi:hypothetical protein
MQNPDDRGAEPSPVQLRRCILNLLYERFREYPYAAVELRQMEEDCRVAVKELNWNMVYLEKCGLVELGTAVECPPYVASTVSLTARGIDLVEDAALFDMRFPRPDPPPEG